MNNYPLISVVIPIFNVEKYVCNMLFSVINQTYKNIEIILVDDGSTDNSVIVCTEYLKKTNAVWKVLQKSNGGAASARNYGIKHANGEWIICPDSDDYLAPQLINKLIDYALTKKVKCVFTNYESVMVDDVGKIVFFEKELKVFKAKKIQHLFLTRKLKLISPGMLLHKTIYESIEYNTKCTYDEDVYFIWELVYLIDEVAFLDSNYYLYVTREGSTVHSLKPDSYLLTSTQYKQFEAQLRKRFPNNRVAKCIHKKYKLGALHVLAKNTNYNTFKETVKKDDYKKGMWRIIFYPNLKLSIYAILYCFSLKLFYTISSKK